MLAVMASMREGSRYSWEWSGPLGWVVASVKLAEADGAEGLAILEHQDNSSTTKNIDSRRFELYLAPGWEDGCWVGGSRLGISNPSTSHLVAEI